MNRTLATRLYPIFPSRRFRPETWRRRVRFVCVLLGLLAAGGGSVGGAQPIAAGQATPSRFAQQLSDFYGTVVGEVIATASDSLVLRVVRVYPYTPLDEPGLLEGGRLQVELPPERFPGTQREQRNLHGTTPPRALAQRFLAEIAVGKIIELGVYGDLRKGTAQLMRLPGPTGLPPDAALPFYLGAQVDETAIEHTLYASATTGSDGHDGRSRESALATLEHALERARAHLDQGQGVKIVVMPGVYRPTSTLRLTDYEDEKTSRLQPLSAVARSAILIIEGEKPGTVFIRGSVTSGFEPETWTLVDADRRVYRHDWPHNFGVRSEGYYKAVTKDVRLHRRELLAINGRLLEPVLLEAYRWIDPTGAQFDENVGLLTKAGAKVEGRTGYIYDGFKDPVSTLAPGQFGVAEKGRHEADHDSPDSLYLRLPDGMNDLRGARIEVGMLSTLLRIQDKSNLVLRNLVFEHAASWWNAYYEKAAIDTNPWGSFSDSRNWLLERVEVRHNRGHGATFFWVRNLTLRDCRFVDNGHLGLRPSFVNEFVMERCSVDRNNRMGRLAQTWVHSVGGLDFTGQNAVFREVTFNENYGRGFRSDYGLEDVLFERCEVARNTGMGGVFHEIEFGPVVWRDSRIVDNSGQQGFGLLSVDRVTLERCVFAGNEGGQIEFYVSPNRYRHLEMLPYGWFKTVDRMTGYDHTGVIPEPFCPRGTIRDFTLRDSEVEARGQNHLMGRFFGVGDIDGYVRMLQGDDFSSEGNRFWHASRSDVFEVGREYRKREFTDLAGWRALTGKDLTSWWGPSKTAEP